MKFVIINIQGLNLGDIHANILGMPRQPRNFEVNGIYHIYNRGYDKRDTFLDGKDYSRFLESLYWFNNNNLVNIRDLTQEERQHPLGLTPGTGDNLRRVQDRKPIAEILASCLMPNHYHMVVKEILDGGISLFMKKLGNGYTAYFNEKYDRKGVGGLFQGTYQSVRIKDDRQLIAIFNYVHTNPVELVEKQWKEFRVKNKKHALDFLQNYPYSSYHDYTHKPRFPRIISTQFYLDLLGGREGCKQSIKSWIDTKAENIVEELYGKEI